MWFVRFYSCSTKRYPRCGKECRIRLQHWRRPLHQSWFQVVPRRRTGKGTDEWGQIPDRSRQRYFDHQEHWWVQQSDSLQSENEKFGSYVFSRQGKKGIVFLTGRKFLRHNPIVNFCVKITEGNCNTRNLIWVRMWRPCPELALWGHFKQWENDKCLQNGMESNR